MKVGDIVRLIGIPPNLPKGDDALPTPAVFQECLGHRFVIQGFNEIGWAEIAVESVTGKVGESIWVELEFLEMVSS